MIKNKRLNRKFSRRLIKSIENFRRRYRCDTRSEAKRITRKEMGDDGKINGRKRRHDVTVGAFAQQSLPGLDINKGDMVIGWCLRGSSSLISTITVISG